MRGDVMQRSREEKEWDGRTEKGGVEKEMKGVTSGQGTFVPLRSGGGMSSSPCSPSLAYSSWLVQWNKRAMVRCT